MALGAPEVSGGWRRSRCTHTHTHTHTHMCGTTLIPSHRTGARAQVTIKSAKCASGAPRPKLTVTRSKVTNPDYRLATPVLDVLGETSSLTVRGIDVDGGLSRPCFRVYQGALSLVDVNCVHGAATWGGGIEVYESGPVTVVGGSFKQCLAIQSGAAVDVYIPKSGAAISFAGTTFSGNLVLGESDASRAVFSPVAAGFWLLGSVYAMRLPGYPIPSIPFPDSERGSQYIQR